MATGLFVFILVFSPMFIFGLIVAGVYLAGLFMLAGGIWRAPEGFEDDEGFHAGSGTAADDTSL